MDEFLKNYVIIFNPPFIFPACIAMMAAVYQLAPEETHLFTFPFNLYGILLFIFGAKVAVEVNKDLRVKEKEMAAQPNSAPVKQLYRDGYYRYTRNPMYLATGMALVGVAVVLPTYYNFIFPVAYVIVVDRFFIMIEEQTMKQTYEQEFVAYQDQVGRWMGRKHSF
jgi:protein-S-isoprenylcysteine O-methyltransferase Ste14